MDYVLARDPGKILYEGHFGYAWKCQSMGFIGEFIYLETNRLDGKGELCAYLVLILMYKTLIFFGCHHQMS